MLNATGSRAPVVTKAEQERLPSLRCQCTGQCGHTHNWDASAPAKPCSAPHGCVIVRKTDYPSFWQLAAGETQPLAYPEYYATEKPVLVEVKRVVLPDGREGKVIGMCQRCKLYLDRGGRGG